MPTGEELRRRIVAARELRGMSQKQLGREMRAEGYGQEDVARIERGEHNAPVLHEGRRLALCRILQVPDWWFTAENGDLFPTERSGVPGLAEHDDYMSRRVQEVEALHQAQHREIMACLNELAEISRDHLLPFLAQQTPTPADELPPSDTAPVSSQGNQKQETTGRRATNRQ